MRREGPTGLILEGAGKNSDDDFIVEEGKKVNVDGQMHGKFVRDALKTENQTEK